MSEWEDFDIRFMFEEDLEQVMEVERDAFSCPWDAGIFRNELRSNKFAHYLVGEYDGHIVGYCGLWIVMDEAQITNIAIHSDYRGRGLGEKMLRFVLNFLKQFKATSLSLEVRVTNDVAKQLYRKVGFKDGGIRKNYYADNSEDALVMWVNVDEAK